MPPAPSSSSRRRSAHHRAWGRSAKKVARRPARRSRSDSRRYQHLSSVDGARFWRRCERVRRRCPPPNRCVLQPFSTDRIESPSFHPSFDGRKNGYFFINQEDRTRIKQKSRHAWGSFVKITKNYGWTSVNTCRYAGVIAAALPLGPYNQPLALIPIRASASTNASALGATDDEE